LSLPLGPDINWSVVYEEGDIDLSGQITIVFGILTVLLCETLVTMQLGNESIIYIVGAGVSWASLHL